MTPAMSSPAAATAAPVQSVLPSRAAANHCDPYRHEFRLPPRWQGGWVITAVLPTGSLPLQYTGSRPIVDLPGFSGEAFIL